MKSTWVRNTSGLKRRNCSLCIHPKRSEIDSLLQDKSISAKEISNTYNLSPSQTIFHRREHLGIVFFYRTKKKIQGTFGPASKTIIQPTRLLSQLERSQIREELDQFFDGEKCIYKNSFSDQKIGEKLDIPWKHVFNMREIAYGPISEQKEKKDPEYLSQLSKIISDLQNFLELLKKTS